MVVVIFGIIAVSLAVGAIILVLFAAIKNLEVIEKKIEPPPNKKMVHKYQCGKPIPIGKGNTNANSGCGDMNCGPCNKFIYGD